MPFYRLITDCLVFGGNPTQAGGMTYYGEVRGRVTINTGVEVATGRVDRLGRTPIVDGIYTTGPAPIVSVPFVDEEKAKLVKHILGATVATSGALKAVLFGRGHKKIAPADIPAVCLLPKRPLAEYPANLADDDEAWWLTAAIPAGTPEFGFELPEGDDIFSPHEVQFIGAVREKDHAGTAIPEAAQVIIKGSVTAAGLASWTTGLGVPADLAAKLAA